LNGGPEAVDGEVCEPVLEEKLGAPIELVSHVLFRTFPDLAVRGPTREPEGRRNGRRRPACGRPGLSLSPGRQPEPRSWARPNSLNRSRSPSREGLSIPSAEARTVSDVLTAATYSSTEEETG
jgi:hypothetical protein